MNMEYENELREKRAARQGNWIAFAICLTLILVPLSINAGINSVRCSLVWGHRAVYRFPTCMVKTPSGLIPEATVRVGVSE